MKTTWEVYQRLVAADRHPDRQAGRHLMEQLIESISHGVSDALTEVASGGPDPETPRR